MHNSSITKPLAITTVISRGKTSNTTSLKDPTTIAQIAWEKARFIDGGGFASIFKVGAQTVAKVGQISDEEVKTQRIQHAHGNALPVLDYSSAVQLPQAIRKKACPVHGPRRHIVPLGESCSCQEELDVLLMPLASLEISTQEFLQLEQRIRDFEDSHPEVRPWDARPANAARYAGRIVALDFGEW